MNEILKSIGLMALAVAVGLVAGFGLVYLLAAAVGIL